MAWIAIVGSLRADSWNGKLVAALAARWPEGAAPLAVTGLAGIPVYDGDLEVAAFPPAVTTMQEQIAASDGVIVATPEYNFGVPGPLKNAFDWTSRGPLGRCWKGKRVVLIGASPGPSGTRSAQFAWWPVFRMAGAHIHPEALMLAGCSKELPGGVPTPELDARLRELAASLARPA